MSENSNNSVALKCPYRATIITRNFGCAHAQEVTRREGPDVGCDSRQLNELCAACFTALKDQALPELGYTDDLTQMPASVLQKIQFGGLLALQALTAPSKSGESVEDISSLIVSVMNHYGEVSNLPIEACIESIKQYKIKRRRGR